MKSMQKWQPYYYKTLHGDVEQSSVIIKYKE